MPSHDANKLEQLLKLVQEASQSDRALREEYKIGDKFRFIRERLEGIVKQLEEQLAVSHQEDEKHSDEIAADETLVYVYLFNVHGLNFATWQKMLTPSVFFEYSINRPIYRDKSHVEAVIRNKPQRAQHGFLMIAVKKELIKDAGVDAFGNPLIKVREGSLKIERLIAFHHNNQEYVVTESGEVRKKE